MDISGLEINQYYIRAIRMARSGNSLRISKFAQVALGEGIISQGQLIDQEQFVKILNNFLKVNRWRKSDWMVVLPEGAIYTTYKLFPELSREDLAEAVEINVPSLLPGDPTMIYYGWQETSIVGQNKHQDEKMAGREAMISSITKENLEVYLLALAKLKIVPLSVEPKASAIARVFDRTNNTLIINLETPALSTANKSNKPIVKQSLNQQEADIGSKLVVSSIIINEGFARFSREVTLEAQSPALMQKQLITEVRRVTNYYLIENDQARIENIILDGEGATKELAQNLTQQLDQGVKLSADVLKVFKFNLNSLAIVGLGIRTMFNQSQDISISLLPVDAKTAFSEKRIIGMIKAVANAVITAFVMFSLILLAAIGLMYYLSRKDDDRLASLVGLTQTSEEISDIQRTIKEINPKLEQAAKLEDQLTYWSPILKTINSLIPEGVVIQDLSYTKADQPLTMIGTAVSREALVAFRDGLSAQDFVLLIQMPSTNFTENKNIKFTISLVLSQDALKPKIE